MRTHHAPALAHGTRPEQGMRLRVTFARADSATATAAPLFADVREASDAFAALMQATYVVHADPAGPGMLVNFELADGLDAAAVDACLERLASTHRLKVL
jgi:hypothetical protein